MKLLPKLKLGPKLARTAYTTLERIGYHFVDLDAEGSCLSSRVIEYSYIISSLAGGQGGRVLDVGCTDGGNMVSPVLASLGWEVYGIDNRVFRFEHPNFRFTHGDIRNTSFPDNFFDYAYAVSTLEHIGLKGRYSVTEEDPEGDIKAVREIARILRPSGAFLLTIPYGRGQIIKPLQRVYDEFRLQKLFSQWKIEEEIYYILQDGCYITTSKETAGQKNHLKGERALALLKLTPLK